MADRVPTEKMQLVNFDIAEGPEQCRDRLRVEKTRRKALHGNPAVVGLAAFAVTTTLFQLHNFGWCGPAASASVGIFFGGVTQLVVGLQCYGINDQFGYCAFTCYGAMWISLPMLAIARNLSIFPVGDHELTAFLFIFGFYTLLLTITSAFHHLALFTTLVFLLVGFFFITLFHWVRDCGSTVGLPSAHVAGAQLSAVELCERDGHQRYKWALLTAATSLVLSSACAFYMMMEILIKDATGWQLPLGPCPAGCFCKSLRNKKAA